MRNPTQSSMEQALVIGCLCGPDLGPTPPPDISNPYTLHYRAKILAEKGSSDEFNLSKEEDEFMTINIVTDQAKKSQQQKIFELVQSDGDADGKIPKDKILILTRFFGIPCDEESSIYNDLPNDVDLSGWFKFMKEAHKSTDDQKQMKNHLTEVFSKSVINTTELQSLLYLYGQNTLDSDDTELFTDYITEGDGTVNVERLADLVKEDLADLKYLNAHGINVTEEELNDALACQA